MAHRSQAATARMKGYQNLFRGSHSRESYQESSMLGMGSRGVQPLLRCGCQDMLKFNLNGLGTLSLSRKAFFRRSSSTLPSTICADELELGDSAPGHARLETNRRQ